MSAYIVNKSHIDAILRTADNQLSWRSPDHSIRGGWKTYNGYDADQVGQMLLDANIQSVAHRYPNDSITELPGENSAPWVIPFSFSPLGKIPTVTEAIKLINCYQYQSCEHPEWKGSEAWSFTTILKEHLICKLPGYDEAPWDWEEERPVNIPVRLI